MTISMDPGCLSALLWLAEHQPITAVECLPGGTIRLQGHAPGTCMRRDLEVASDVLPMLLSRQLVWIGIPCPTPEQALTLLRLTRPGVAVVAQHRREQPENVAEVAELKRLELKYRGQSGGWSGNRG